MSNEELLAGDLEIEKLVNKNAIIRCQEDKVQCISNVFLTPKKDGGYRMILNLKSFNDYITKQKFKMETIDHILAAMTEGCFMTIVDLSDAYLTLPVSQLFWKFLKFRWRGDLYMYVVLPFGLTSAPRLFTKVMKSLVTSLRKQGHIVIFYLDDGWQCGQTFDICLNTCIATCKLLTSCGFLLNLSKSCLVPSQQVSVLGFDLDSVTMSITISENKSQNILNMIREHLTSVHSVRQVARLIGKLISIFRVLPRGQQYYRPLEVDKLSALRENFGKWDEKCPLSYDSQCCLLWWSHNIPGARRSITRHPPDLILQTDSSSYAWGGYLNGMTAQGRFSQAEMSLSINTKETLAIWYSMRSFKKYLNCTHLLVQSDNTTAVSYVHKMGGMKSELRNRISADIWSIVDSLGFDFSISYLPGRFNGNADLASRLINYRTEWCLPKKYYKKLCKHFQIQPTIDLFASRLNYRVKRYVLYAPDPFCVHVDAFTMSWSNEIPYLFPPFNLLHRVLQQIRRDKCLALLVFPLWPSQPWFPSLLNMITHRPVQLPSICQLFLPWDRNHRHPHQNLKLCSVVLSGKDFVKKATPAKPPSVSSDHGAPVLRRATQPTSPDICCSVQTENWIQCDLLSP